MILSGIWERKMYTYSEIYMINIIKNICRIYKKICGIKHIYIYNIYKCCASSLQNICINTVLKHMDFIIHLFFPFCHFLPSQIRRMHNLLWVIYIYICIYFYFFSMLYLLSDALMKIRIFVCTPTILPLSQFHICVHIFL